MSSAFWDERYQQPEYAYGDDANAYFAEHLPAPPHPGARLLLPCEGEGRNAVHAARLGWQVDAFDFSEFGREKCRQLAARHRVAVNYELADARQYAYSEAQYDAAALIFAHFPPQLRPWVHGRVAAALKPGGMLILEAFQPAQLQNSSGGPKTVDMLYDVPMLSRDFEGLQCLEAATAEVTLNEGPYHQGKADVVRFRAIKPG